MKNKKLNKAIISAIKNISKDKYISSSTKVLAGVFTDVTEQDSYITNGCYAIQFNSDLDSEYMIYDSKLKDLVPKINTDNFNHIKIKEVISCTCKMFDKQDHVLLSDYFHYYDLFDLINTLKDIINKYNYNFVLTKDSDTLEIRPTEVFKGDRMLSFNYLLAKKWESETIEFSLDLNYLHDLLTIIRAFDYDIPEIYIHKTDRKKALYFMSLYSVGILMPIFKR